MGMVFIPVKTQKIFPHMLCTKLSFPVFQFDVLFTEELYLECGKNGIRTASMLRKGLKEISQSLLFLPPLKAAL